jgi:two-component system, chemotaxis family, protein-glutamate methylesterase/glutaminase
MLPSPGLCPRPDIAPYAGLVSATGRTAAAARFEVVALVASLGGLSAVSRILAALPAEFPAHVLVVQHGRRDHDPGVLVRLFRRVTPLPISAAGRGTTLRGPGVTVIPTGNVPELDADRRIILGPVSGPADGLRAGDTLLTSLATAFGPRAIAVVLTGMLHDGAAGVRAVKRLGGRVLVQEPATARAGSMPASAIATGCVDFVLPLDRIAAALTALTMAPGAAELFTVPIAPWAKLHA